MKLMVKKRFYSFLEYLVVSTLLLNYKKLFNIGE